MAPQLSLAVVLLSLHSSDLSAIDAPIRLHLRLNLSCETLHDKLQLQTKIKGQNQTINVGSPKQSLHTHSELLPYYLVFFRLRYILQIKQERKARPNRVSLPAYLT